MDDRNDQSAKSATATNGVVESEAMRAQEALLGDADPSLTSADDVAKALNVDLSQGLSEEEAKRRLAQFGPNELASAPPVPKWRKFLAQFQDPLVYLLIAATVISVIAWFIERSQAQPGAEGGEALPFDAIVIMLILVVNAVLGYMQEAKAEAAVEALAQMTAPQTSVLRGGRVMRINTTDVVPGDIIVLAEGDSVSADGRLVNAASLRIAEASLTGESVPVGKKPDTLAEAKALGDRSNMIFNGTSVTQGTGRAIVTGTGMNTQVGKIAGMLSATEDEKTPLQKEMDYVSKILRSLAYRGRPQGQGRSQDHAIHARGRDPVHFGAQAHVHHRQGQHRFRQAHRVRQGCAGRAVELLLAYPRGRTGPQTHRRRPSVDSRRRRTSFLRGVSHAR